MMKNQRIQLDSLVFAVLEKIMFYVNRIKIKNTLSGMGKILDKKEYFNG